MYASIYDYQSDNEDQEYEWILPSNSLTDACKAKNLDQLKQIVNKYQLTDCFKCCIEKDFSEGVQFLLDQGPECKRSLDTTTWIDPHSEYMKRAMVLNHKQCILAFLEHGCYPNGGYGDHHEPLFFSVRSIEMAHVLLDYGADINECNRTYWDNEDIEEKTSLFDIMCYQLALGHVDNELFLFFIESGLTPEWNSCSDHLCHFLFQKNFVILKVIHENLNLNHYKGYNEENLLFETIRNRNVEGVKFLLELGLQNKPNKKKQTPLQFATYIATNHPSAKINEICELMETHYFPMIKEPV